MSREPEPAVSAARPWVAGKAPHLRVGPEEVAPYALLPGDPDRVNQIGTLLEDFTLLANNREFRTGRGQYKGIPVLVTSTGIGGPSTEIAVAELLGLGVRTLIRVGGCGALQPEIRPGDFIIPTASVRLGGASIQYARPEYPAAAHYEVILALIQAAALSGKRPHIGVGATTATYYEGQQRHAIPDRPLYRRSDLIEELKGLGVLNLEMEAETLYTLSSIYGARSGAVLAVHGNRTTDQWMTDFGPSLLTACQIALESVKLLAQWDQKVQDQGASHFYPAL